MKNYIKGGLLKTLFGLLFSQIAVGQDFTLSQFQTNAHIFNPACIGNSESEVKLGVTYRNQWYASGFPYQTIVASGEMKFNPKPGKIKQMAVALSFADDQIGNGQWRNTWVFTGVSIAKNLDDANRHSLSFGISSALLMRQFNAKNLIFENQFETSTFEFNPSLSSGENEGALRQSFFQVNSGLNYKFIVDEHLEFGIGASALWLYRPNEALTNLTTNSFAKMNSRFTGIFSARWKMTDDLWIDPQVFLSQQGKAREINFGGWLVFNSTLEKNKFWQTSFGCFSRLSDAIIPAIRLGTERIFGQLSYDFTTSGAKNANIDEKFMGLGGMGALEFSLVYGLDFRPKYSKSFPIPCQKF